MCDLQDIRRYALHVSRHSFRLTIFFITMRTEQLHFSILRDAAHAHTPTYTHTHIIRVSLLRD